MIFPFVGSLIGHNEGFLDMIVLHIIQIQFQQILPGRLGQWEYRVRDSLNMEGNTCADQILELVLIICEGRSLFIL